MLAKYTELLRLRRGDLDGSIPDPRPAMALLASAFPGALREIDRCPMHELERRKAYLQGLLEPATHERDDNIEPWAPLGMRYHELLRGALEAKRWLATRPLKETTRERFVQEAGSLRWGSDALTWASSLEAIATPPQGRLVNLVLEQLARENLRSAEELRTILFSYERDLTRRPRRPRRTTGGTA